MYRSGLCAALGLLGLFFAPFEAAATEGRCPPAHELVQRGLDAAEAAARACVEAAPDDAEALLTLSRILGWKGAIGAAIEVAAQAAAGAPQDLDILSWRLRLLGWDGRFDEADRLLAASDPPRGVHEELELVVADLSSWRSAPPSSSGPPVAIGLGIWLQAGPVATGGEDLGWLGRVRGDGEVLPNLHLAGGFEVQERRYADLVARDTNVSLAATLRLADRLTLEGGAGFGLNPTFTPEWNAYLEAGLGLGGGFTAYGRYWHIEFRRASVEVLSPALHYAAGRLWASLRSWHAFEPDRGPGLALLGQAGLSVLPGLGVSAGVGGGDRADYLLDRLEAAEEHVAWVAGVSWHPGDTLVFRLDYVGRREAVEPADELYRHELLLGVYRRW